VTASWQLVAAEETTSPSNPPQHGLEDNQLHLVVLLHRLTVAQVARTAAAAGRSTPQSRAAADLLVMVLVVVTYRVWRVYHLETAQLEVMQTRATASVGLEEEEEHMEPAGPAAAAAVILAEAAAATAVPPVAVDLSIQEAHSLVLQTQDMDISP
jgi:hypothetical protein